ncbi:TPA: ead/Ea22-like family protein [Citrobacter freundii]
MTALNKQALREAANAANIASWGKWESYKPHKGARGYEVRVGAKAVAQHCLKVDSAFIAAANPSTVLALLDELEAAEKRNAELEGIVFSVKLPVAPLQHETLKLCLETSDGYGMQKGAEYMRDEIIKVLHAAGIGVKGE